MGGREGAKVTQAVIGVFPCPSQWDAINWPDRVSFQSISRPSPDMLLPVPFPFLLLLLPLLFLPSNSQQMPSRRAPPVPIRRAPLLNRARTRTTAAATIPKQFNKQNSRKGQNVARQSAPRPAPRQFPIPQYSPAVGNGKSLKQCLCSELKPCKERYMQALEPCLESCQNIVKPLGGNMKQLWQCFKQRDSLLKATISCTENRHENACAKRSGLVMPQRYNQNLQIMATAEIDKMISRMGLQKEARPFLSTGKKLFECVKACMNKRSGSCEKSMNCGLALPSDKELVEGAKQCAIQGGFNTASAQQICRCAMAAGVKNLSDNLCSRVIIS